MINEVLYTLLPSSSLTGGSDGGVGGGDVAILICKKKNSVGQNFLGIMVNIVSVVAVSICKCTFFTSSV